MPPTKRDLTDASSIITAFFIAELKKLEGFLESKSTIQSYSTLNREWKRTHDETSSVVRSRASNGKLSNGAISGSVIGSLVLVSFICVVAFLLSRGKPLDACDEGEILPAAIQREQGAQIVQARLAPQEINGSESQDSVPPGYKSRGGGTNKYSTRSSLLSVDSLSN